MKRLLLVAVGALGALYVRLLCRSSVAFPKALRAAGEKIQTDVAEMREFHDQMDQLGLTQEQRERVAQGYLWAKGYRSSSAGPTR